MTLSMVANLDKTIERQSTAIKILSVVAGSLFIASVAQIRLPLPFTPVPVTGQTFGVLFTAALLGKKWGPASVILYVLEGALGLPFFQGATSGLLVLVGPTAGYIWGFILGAILVSSLTAKGWGETYFKSLAMFTLGLIPIFALGLLWLGHLFGYDKVLAMGFYPFLMGAAYKTVLAATLLTTLKKQN